MRVPHLAIPLLLLAGAARAGELSIDAGPTRVAGAVASFRELRDRGVVRQRHDYSCGAAALATLLTHGFGDPAGEEQLLREVMSSATEATQRLIRNKGLSLLDMQRLAQARGYRAQGYRLRPADLARLRRPVIVFLRPLGYDHFAVLKGIRRDRALLADPSLGNWTVPVPRLLDMWLGAGERGVVFVVERPDGSWPRGPLLVEGSEGVVPTTAAATAATPATPAPTASTASALPPSTPAPPVGEPRAAQTAEEVSLRDRALLPRGRHTLETSLAYGRSVLELGASRVEATAATAQVAWRYGVIEDVQLTARLPARYQRESVTFQPEASAPPVSRSASRSWMGDASIGAVAVVLREGAGRPNLLASLDGVLPTGRGDAGVGAGLTATRSHDPVILFAGASYLYGLRPRPEDARRALARHNVGFGAGLAFAVNEAVALTLQLAGTLRDRAAGSGGVTPVRESYRLQTGLTLLVTPRLFVEPTVAVAVGAANPDLTLGLNVPWSF